ncbi:hypothetical protein ACFPXP_08625 [Marinicrinis lubricantis]|uniref:Regulatory protein RecX n=1 Tax=Marinicrinis lubricantis TaxID=2086470 RepID=A0ABW1IN27_9BACL
MDIYYNIGILLKYNGVGRSELIEEMNKLLESPDISEQLQLHDRSNKNQLTQLFNILKFLQVSPSAKEHIVWKYYKDKFEGRISKHINVELLKDLLHSYKQHNYSALESIIIDALKTDSIKQEDIIFLEETFSSRSFVKELFAYKCRMEIRRGRKLSKEHIVQLLNAREYFTLRFALERKAIMEDGLAEFRKPTDNEKDRKHKEWLYHMAQDSK